LNQGDSESSEFRSVQELARCKSSRENVITLKKHSSLQFPN
ncbi:8079_t:CDS:1, partial [Rhizophagus irregularis]